MSEQPIITRYRDANANLRTQFERIIKRAGLKPWPKLFHNLRATRQTELAEQFPMHVVCEWIGNSQAVAQEHYLRVTDEHFAKATGGGAAESASVPATGASSPEGTITPATSRKVQWRPLRASLDG